MNYMTSFSPAYGVTQHYVTCIYIRDCTLHDPLNIYYTCNMDVTSLLERYNRLFPVATDLPACLDTVHNSYKLFQIHDGHTEKDGHLEEGMYAVYPVILHCVKEILTTKGKKKGEDILADQATTPRPQETGYSSRKYVQ